jgi:hypothetical protein
MGAIDLLCDLMAEGVEFSTDGQQVRWRDAGGKLTPERLEVLKDGKSEVLQFLTAHTEPDLDAFEERAAICEYDGGLLRADAEGIAAQCQGFSNVIAFRAACEEAKARAKLTYDALFPTCKTGEAKQ